MFLTTGYTDGIAISFFPAPSYHLTTNWGVRYFRQGEVNWRFVPVVISCVIILALGLFLVVFVYMNMKVLYGKRLYLQLGVWLSFGTIVGVVGNGVPSANWVLFTGNFAELLFMFSLLMCERLLFRIRELDPHYLSLNTRSSYNFS